MDEIARVAKNTEWNGGKVLIGATNNDYNANDPVLTSNIQLGAGASQTMVLTFRSWVPTVAYDSDQSTAGGTGADGLDQNDLSAYSNSGSSAESAANSSALFWSNSGTVTRIDITSVGNASQAISALDNAINGAAAERARYGAFMSRLQHASDNLANVALNTAASRSQIADADYAAETTELARTQIVSQASTAMLAQANQVKQTVLSLLQ
jgi:flagellin